MPFAYYARLSAGRRRIYDRSDAIERIDLPDAAALRPLVAPLEAAMKSENRAEAERLCAGRPPPERDGEGNSRSY